MYADRVEAGAKASIRDRLNGDTADDSGRRRQIAGKRYYVLSLSHRILLCMYMYNSGF